MWLLVAESVLILASFALVFGSAAVQAARPGTLSPVPVRGGDCGLMKADPDA